MERALEKFEAKLDLAEEEILPEEERLALFVSHMHAYYYAYFSDNRAFRSIGKTRHRAKKSENRSRKTSKPLNCYL